jgi:hypothetical protein
VQPSNAIIFYNTIQLVCSIVSSRGCMDYTHMTVHTLPIDLHLTSNTGGVSLDCQVALSDIY